jgi:hypothetical protein
VHSIGSIAQLVGSRHSKNKHICDRDKYKINKKIKKNASASSEPSHPVN